MPYHTIIPYLWYATHWAYVRVRLKWMTYVCDIAPLYPTDHNFRALKSGDPHSEEQTLCPSPDFEASKLRNVWSRKFRAQNTFREKLLWKKRSRSGEDQSMHINISSRLSLFSKNFTLYGNWQCAKNMYHWNCNGCSTKTLPNQNIYLSFIGCSMNVRPQKHRFSTRLILNFRSIRRVLSKSVSEQYR